MVQTICLSKTIQNYPRFLQIFSGRGMIFLSRKREECRTSQFVFNDITVTDVQEAFTNRYFCGRELKIPCRHTCGIILAAEGKTVYRHAAGDAVSDPRHALFLPKGLAYSLECLESGVSSVLNFHAEHYPDRVVRIETADLSGLLRMQHEIERVKISEPFQRTSAIGTVYHMLALLEEKPASDMTPSSLKKATNFIVRNYPLHELDTQMIAAAAGISEVYLRKLFHQYLGISPMRYVNTCRMKYAMSLLSGSSRSVSDIALDCGCVDHASFSKAFRRYSGCSPSEYRAKTNP